MLAQFIFENYSIIFNTNEPYETFEDSSCYGIKFIRGKASYELVHNMVGLTRIFIREDEGHLKDIPFHEGTMHLLPKGIVCQKIPEGYKNEHL